LITELISNLKPKNQLFNSVELTLWISQF
jgi:hypothetical protein